MGEDLVVDASVLIDYLDVDPTLLTAAARHCGRVLVTTAVVEEVWGAEDSTCTEFGLTHYVLTVEQQNEVFNRPASPLTAADYSCYVVARDEACTCWTNDKALRRLCTDGGVRTAWGLQLMLDLVAAREITKGEALRVAEAIWRANSTITDQVLGTFQQKLQAIT